MSKLEENASLVTALTEIEKKVGQAEIDRDNLKTNLSAKGVDVASINKMSELVNSIPNMKLGKKWASGTVQISPSGVNGFPMGEVNNIPFKPNIVIVFFSTTYYKMNFVAIRKNSFYNNTDEQITGNTWWIDRNTNGNIGSEIILSEDGFKVYPGNHSSGFRGMHNWITFE